MRKLNKVLIPAFALTVAFSGYHSVNAMEVAPKEIKVTLDDKTKTVTTDAITVKSLLNNLDNSYNYKKTDEVNHLLTEQVSENMNLVITTNKKVTIVLKGKEKTVTTKATTVEEFLKEMKVDLGKDDSVIPSLDSNLKDEDKVMIIYTKEKKEKVKKEIPNEVKKSFSFDVEYGKKKVVSKGQKGVLEKEYKRLLKNDILVSEKLLSEKIVKRPVEREILIGTKEIVDKKLKNTTIKKKTNNLYKGETEVIQEGNKGTERLIYKNDGKKRKLVFKEVIVEPVEKIIAIGTKERPVEDNSSTQDNSTQESDSQSTPTTSNTTTAKYSLSQFKFNGVVNWGGKKFTYYSQSVLPGGGLSIPGRHVNSGGYVSDGDGYIAVAANRSIPKGTIVNTPFGYKGKVYDICAGCSPNWIDIYIK